MYIISINLNTANLGIFDEWRGGALQESQIRYNFEGQEQKW